jgi:hypothetical protein
MAGHLCEQCPKGFVQSDPGQAACTKCSPGEFIDVEGDVLCKLCVPNTYYSNKGRDRSCIGCPTGWDAERGSARCQSCVAGKAGKACKKCVAGRYRGNADQDFSKCIECEMGKHSSENGQPFCLDCDAGTYAKGTGANVCKNCPTGYYQNEKRATTCETCKNGLLPNNDILDNGDQVEGSGSTSCVRPPWQLPSDCKDNAEYLNDSDYNKMHWACINCPLGANCIKYHTMSTLVAQDGWWRVPPEYNPGPHLFAQCPHQGDCKNGTCVNGTTGNLCSICEVGNDRVSSKCTKCVPNEILIRVLVLVAVVIVLIVLIIQAYQKFRKLHRRYVNAIKDALLAIKIIITYLQINLSIPGMITSFEFPPNYRTFMANLSFVNVDFMSVLGIQVSHILLVSLWGFFSFLSANATRQTD